jgi:hypothetical protein
MQTPIKLADLDDVALTASQGFRAMAKFLSGYFERTNRTGSVRTLVGDVEIESDGSSTDPAALSDWQECVMTVLAEDGLSPALEQSSSS